MKSLRISAALGLLFRPSATPSVTALGLRAQTQTRWAHKSASSGVPLVPSPIPFVPDVETFLTLIGRGLKQHASKFPTWESLFTLSSDQLRELGIEPARTRRYLLRWRENFRYGKFGPGGDFKYVENGTADLRVLEVEKSPLVKDRRVVNVPPGKKVDELSPGEMVRPKGYHVERVKAIVGPYALPKGIQFAQVKVTEGMWEDKRGHKVDGGERRREEVRFKKRVAERKALREAQGYY
ncbi:hypothetical protein VTJ83DRAFT_3476 [Remersonia thermophila]|uniref:Small ribosomal subunit protein mS41 n=1 Tax=Remersonia thermophila TaxID=72144 RepID=A0ABR4DEA1_9PEZI